MCRAVLVTLVFSLLSVMDTRSRAAGSDNTSINSSNGISLAQARQLASEQLTNAVLWLNYGKAALKEVIVQMEKTGLLPSTNSYDEAIYAFGKGLQLDPKNYELQNYIAIAYERRAMRKPSEDDQTKYDDYEKAIEHCSLASGNARINTERSLMEQEIAQIRERIKIERKRPQEIEALNKKPLSEQLKQLAEETKKVMASEKDLALLDDARKRVQREPQNTEALLDCADRIMNVEYTGLGNTNAVNEIRVLAEKSIGLDEHNWHAYELMAECADMQGDPTNAISYYERALKENPDRLSISNSIADIKHRMSLGLE